MKKYLIFFALLVVFFGCGEDGDFKVEENTITGEFKILEYYERADVWISYFDEVPDRIKTKADACKFVQEKNRIAVQRRKINQSWKKVRCVH